MKILSLLALMLLVSCDSEQSAFEGPTPAPAANVSSGVAPVSGG
jgi:hypothetical protein